MIMGKTINFKNLMSFSFIPLILLIGIVPGLSFADYSDDPYDQMEDGFLPHEILCKIGKVPIIRNNGLPACVFADTADEWEEDGIGVTDPLVQCRTGFVHLEHPSTGAIICQGQSSFQKFVDQGWMALDGPPAKKDTKLDQCRGGQIHVQSPTLGTILCRTPSDAQQLIDGGWIVLDDLATFTASGLTQCDANHVAMAGDTTGNPTCVRSNFVNLFKSEGFTILEEEPLAGIPTMRELTGCRGSNTFHLKNPASGIIACVEQSMVLRYLDRGWEVLYDLPFNVP